MLLLPVSRAFVTDETTRLPLCCCEEAESPLNAFGSDLDARKGLEKFGGRSASFDLGPRHCYPLHTTPVSVSPSCGMAIF
jgi:hypothetical protein